MTKVIWLSDLHFTAHGRVQDHDPRQRLQAAISFINANHADADHCILSGDLVDRGTAADYAALAEMLLSLNIPVLPMVGNHDHRDLLRAHLTMPPHAMTDFVQYAVAIPDAQILCLDTQKTGSDAGMFCTERKDWLDAQLRTTPEIPAYLFLHHPPARLGLPMQDADCMENGDAFLDVLAQHPNVKHLFIGHVHRPITGTLRGIPFTTMRSVLYQAPPPQPAWTWDSFAPAAEPPQLGVLTLNGPNSRLHYTQFCDYSIGT